ncbi:MAG TPA: hypothetical protein PKH77_19895 [Anaerolineae bacterium]|nr:hypothetical protein [Anaerolineae bacterium]
MNCHLCLDPRDPRPVEIELLSADGRLVIGTASRAGVTPPRYALRSTYRVEHGYLYDPARDAVPEGLYVLDDGQLVPLDEWYAEAERQITALEELTDLLLNHGMDTGNAVTAGECPAPEPKPAATPQTFQRGDVVDVTFSSGFTYRGIVRSVRRGEVHVITRNSGHSYTPANAQITLVERRGRRNAATLHEWAREFE